MLWLMQTTTENAAETESRLFLLSWSMILVLVLAVSLILFLLVMWVIVRAWRRSTRQGARDQAGKAVQIDAWAASAERFGDGASEHEQ